MTRNDHRARRVATGLLPVIRVKGEDVRWPIEERLLHHGCPGVGVAVIEGDDIAWAEGFGLLEKGNSLRVDNDTMFAGASISKPVTALLALQLVERGLLHLDRNVNETLRSWKVPENEFTAKSPVTLRWLLSHKAGTNVHGFGAHPVGAAMPTLVQILEGEPPATTPPVRVDKIPGGTVRYSGGGTTIAQLLIEDATGRTFADLAREMIFEPLAMRRTTFVNPLPDGFRANAAVGHDEAGNVFNGKWVNCAGGAQGGIYTTASDYARFMIACRKAYFDRSNDLLPHALAVQMMTPRGEDDQGLGWRILGSGMARRFEHGGSNGGYQCETTCYLDDGKGAVVLTNAVSGLVFYWEVLNAIADVHCWREFMPPAKTVVPFTDKMRAALVGEYKIVSGVEMPSIKVWAEGGKLVSEIPGMRGGPRELLMDERGRLFNRMAPYETEVKFDSAGVACELVAFEGATNTEILRAVRA